MLLDVKYSAGELVIRCWEERKQSSRDLPGTDVRESSSNDRILNKFQWEWKPYSNELWPRFPERDTLFKTSEVIGNICRK